MFCRFIPADGPLMDDSLHLFIRDQQRRNLSPGTIARRQRVLLAFEGFLEVRPEDATRSQIETWLDTCSLTGRSRHVYLSTLHCFYEFCQREGIRGDDPTRRLPRPRVARLLPRPITDDDLALAIRSARPTMRAWLSLAAFEGFRCLEIAGLRWEDVDPPRIFIHHGKGGHQAVLPLNPQVTSALHLSGLPSHGFVFTMRNGAPYLPGTISSYIARYLMSLGINATAHQLRHWYGSKVWAATKDMRVTQELMRHQDIKTTAIYAAWDRDLAVEAVTGLRV